MEEILQKLENMDQRNARIEQKLDNIHSQLQILKKENQALKNENYLLREATKKLETRVIQIEKDSRRENLIINGIEEEVRENAEQLNDKVREVLKRVNTNINVESDVIESRRIGDRNKLRNRPILLKVKTWDKKLDILKGRNRLKGTNIYINEDFPKEIMEQRKQLLKYSKVARDKGCRTKIIYNKLYINDKLYTLSELEAQNETEIETEEETGLPEQTPAKGRKYSERSPEGAEETTKKITKMNREVETSSKN